MKFQMSGVQHDFVTNLVFDGSSFCPIVDRLHYFLCMSQSVLCRIPISRHLFREFFCCIAFGGFIDTRFKTFPWMSSGSQEERRKSGCLVPMVIIGEFGEREFLRPIALILVAEESLVCFDFLIHPFCLSISLRMVCGRRILLDFEQFV